MRTPSPRITAGGAYATAFVAVAAVGIYLARPLQGGPAGPDAAASVLFFDRIAAGRHLEVFVNTTPKPLLTVVLGGLHAITGDWQAGAVATVLAAALGIVLAVELTRRVAGIEAAVFAGVALVGLASFQAETSWSYGLPWAFLSWMAAGLQLVRPQPRYGVAGFLLLLGGLARPETLIIVGVATLILVFLTVRGPRPPRAAWLLMIGWLAVAAYAAHDLMLTGDPLWWTRVASHSVALAGGRARSLAGVLHLSASLLLATWLLVVAACIGGLRLLWIRSWVAAAGLIALGPLVILYTWFLAIEHVNVLSHYFHPVDLAVVLAAAVGIGFLLVRARRRVAERDARAAGWPGTVAACGLAFLLAVAMSHPFAPLSGGARASSALEALIASRIAAVDPLLDRSLPVDRSGTGVTPGPLGAPDPSRALLFVPAHRIARFSLDLGLPLTRILGIDASKVDLAHGYPPVGSVVYIDGFVEPASAGPGTKPLQVDVPTVVDGVRIVPLLTDPAAGEWVVRIDPAP